MDFRFLYGTVLLVIHSENVEGGTQLLNAQSRARIFLYSKRQLNNFSPCDCLEKECYCVDYNTCNETTNTIIIDNFIQPRSNLGKQLKDCPPFEMCCPMPEDKEEEDENRAVATARRCCKLDRDECYHREGDFPWMLAVLKKNKKNINQSIFRCGATLINNQVALTDADCVSGFFHTQLLVLAGGIKPKVGSGRVVDVRNITILQTSPRMALLQLKEKIENNKNLPIIPLANSKTPITQYKCCIFTGWGKDGSGVKNSMKAYEMRIMKGKHENEIRAGNKDINPDAGTCKVSCF